MDLGASSAVWILALLMTTGAIWIMSAAAFGRHFIPIAAPVMIGALAASAFIPILRWHLIWFTPLVLFIAYAIAFRKLFALAFRVHQLNKSLGGTEEEAQAALNRIIEGKDPPAPADDKTN